MDDLLAHLMAFPVGERRALGVVRYLNVGTEKGNLEDSYAGPLLAVHALENLLAKSSLSEAQVLSSKIRSGS